MPSNSTLDSCAVPVQWNEGRRDAVYVACMLESAAPRSLGTCSLSHAA